MSDDDRARRSALLNAAAKAKSQAKTNAAEQAIRALVKRREPVTFQAVSREAGVSHAFLYAHQDLRRRIEHLRAQAHPVPAPHQRTETAETIVLALTAQIEQLRKQHRHEVQALRTALEQAHGENLDLRRELALRGPAPRPSGRP
jgi:CRISPR/Cas system-associated endonuclease Cas1